MDRAALLVLATSAAFVLASLAYASVEGGQRRLPGLHAVVVALALSSAGHFALYSLGWIAWRGG